MKNTIIIMMLGLVLLSFAWTAAASDEREHGRSAYPGKFYGTVESIPVSGRDGIWVINGREILVTGNTKIEEEHGKAVPGAFVEVKGDYTGKIFTAYEIEVKGGGRSGEIHPSHEKSLDGRSRDYSPDQERVFNSRLQGVIDAMPQTGYEGIWVIDGRKIDVTNKTLIDETGGKAVIGAFAKIKGIRSGDTITAYEIEIEKKNK